MNEPMEQGKSSSLKLILAVLLIILIVIISLSQDMEQIKGFILSSGWAGLGVAVGLYALLGASPIPSEPLTVFISTIFGPFTATLIAGFGNLLAALVEFFIGGRISDVTSFDKYRQKLPLGLGKLPVDSPIFLIVARMLPGYGPKFVSVVSGIYRVPMWRYIWTTLISTLLGAALFAYGGFGLIHMW
ncbi:MAG: VTT domain-containing protein [Anaerolineaceae bacterium]|nr:VTT domain-containing protein [Anaerolineaceae bacterium]